MQWRAKWASNWDDVKYCSNACRSQRPTELDHQLEQWIVDACAAAPFGRAVSESQIVKEAQLQSDRVTAERVRRAARRLAAASKVEFIQKNRVVAPSTARGDLDYRLIR